MIWAFIMLITLTCFVFGLIYLTKRINKFTIIQKIEKDNKVLKKLIPITILVISVIILSVLFSVTNAIVILLHYLLLWLILDFIFYLIKKEFKYYIPGIITIIIVPIYLCFGWYSAHTVYKTDYNFTTNKINNDLKIVQFSDSHIGTTFDSEGFKKELEKIENEKPDIILLTGDFVDDGTSKEEMIKSCKYLGEIKTKYGIYFAHGNHDKGYYGSKRGFTKEELEQELEKNKIVVLQDESILINNEFYIIGRKDYEDSSRKSIEDLTKKLDKDKYMIVMDHQPTDYENESSSKVDLVLSGHTHGGQLIPINFLNTVLSDNYRVYGKEKRDNTNFIVSSGLSDWEIKFKTGCISEYVVINIQSEKEEETKMEEIYLKVNDNVLNVKLEDNEATKELMNILKEKDIEIKAEDYGSFEKVGNLGFSLPQNDKNIKTETGDIMLYQGNKLVLFYGSNEWDYTKIGKIQNVTKDELKSLLGEKTVKLTFSINK